MRESLTGAVPHHSQELPLQDGDHVVRHYARPVAGGMRKNGVEWSRLTEPQLLDAHARIRNPVVQDDTGQVGQRGGIVPELPIAVAYEGTSESNG